MCGIAGVHSWTRLTKDPLPLVQRMVESLRHRGPDQCGVYLDDEVGLGQSRLSIIDLYGGSQPISNEDGTLWLVCNGEIFNYVELRKRLRQLGHRFATRCDVEVLLHLFEEFGPDMLKMINGQFAMAIWDIKQHRLFLARDHVGICPLYYVAEGYFAFASEMKSLFCLPTPKPTLDETALAQTCVFWSPLPGKTPFSGIREIKPGCYMWVQEDYLQEIRYWRPEYAPAEAERIHDPETAAELTRELIQDAVRIRLRADVPVGAYLSGGLDSSITTAMIRRLHSGRLRTFSIGFENPHYDETFYQQMVSSYLGTEHTALATKNTDLGAHLLDVIWHAEKPLLRSAPIPLFMLSNRVRQSGFKVVLTGEGADEFFSGYNIYKETKVRQFIARQPESERRKKLLQRIYPYLDGRDDRNSAFWRQFFLRDVMATDDPFYSHRLRWQNGAFLMQFFSPELLANLGQYDPVEELRHQTDGMMDGLDPLARAHFLEYYVFLGSYLLCSQGDRMIMSHGIEGRYPFLDKRVIQLALRLDPRLKMRGLNEKWILKRSFADMLPEQVVNRTKQPYRAPIRDLYLASMDRLHPYLQSDRLKSSGLFNASKVDLLYKRLIDSKRTLSAREEMTLMFIMTVQMLDELFNDALRIPAHSLRSDWLIYDKRGEREAYTEKGNWHHAVT
jgi:asparagine synthase (glutamine-hydrolysing)